MMRLFSLIPNVAIKTIVMVPTADIELIEQVMTRERKHKKCRINRKIIIKSLTTRQYLNWY